MAEPAGLLAKQRVHHVGATTRADWTRTANRGTRETTGSVRRSIEAVTEGLEDQLQALTPAWSRPSAYATRTIAPSGEAVDAAAPVDAQNASTAAWKSRPAREIPTAPTAILFFLETRRTKHPYDDARPDLRGFR